MKLLLLLLFLLCTSLQAEKINVTADNFEADENKKTSTLTGHVHITKGTDDIKADTLKIYFDTDNKPIKYQLSQNVSFDITTKTQRFVGQSQEILYDPKEKIYIASGDVIVHDKISDHTLQGEKIIINRNSGKSKITGKKNRPVKFTFTVDEK